MQIIEQYIIGKRSEALCEDGIIVTDNFVAVIDGSTSKSRLNVLKAGETGGQLAMRAVKEVVCETDAQTDMKTFCKQATAKIQQLYAQHYTTEIIQLLNNHPEDRFCCSAIVFSRYRNEIWMIGDCQALAVWKNNDEVKTKHFTNNKPYEAVIARQRCAYLKKALTNGANMEELRLHDIGRDIILPQLVAAMQGENIDYAVIDGFPIPMQKLRKIHRALEGLNEIILASDGYPRLFPTLEETESYLQSYLQKDPLCITRHKATKGWMKNTASFDDRAYIRFAI